MRASDAGICCQAGRRRARGNRPLCALLGIREAWLEMESGQGPGELGEAGFLSRPRLGVT